ncbi:MAG: hypothetical protein LBJ19_00850 [Holosporaceae bacterium]|jgi:predicted Zn-dependent peptidase|nr:hypothetical protein [Holosporaceae bacterium]
MSKKIKVVIFFLLAMLIVAPVFLKKEKAAMMITSITSKAGVKTTLVTAKNRKISFVTLRFTNAGILQNSPEEHGISCLLGHLLLRRVNRLSAEDTAEKFMQLGLRDLKCSCDEDDFIISFYVSNDRIQDAAHLLSMAFKSPTISDGDLKQAKNIFPVHMSDEFSPPGMLLLDRLLGLLYDGSVYGFNRDGSSISINGVTLDALQQFMRANLTVQNLKATIVGDLSRSEINSFLSTLCEPLPKKYSVITSDKLTCGMAENKVCQIQKSSMKDMVGIMVGVRLDNLTDLELAAVYIIIDAIFDDKIGDFFCSLKQQGIACTVTYDLLEYRLSCTFVLRLYLDRADLEKFQQCFGEKFIEYNRNRCIHNLEQKKRNHIMIVRQSGFVNYDNIDQKLKNLHLPFEKVTAKVIDGVMAKLFDEQMRRIVIIRSPPGQRI